MQKLCEMLISEPHELGAQGTVEVSCGASKRSWDLVCFHAGQRGVAVSVLMFPSFRAFHFNHVLVK